MTWTPELEAKALAKAMAVEPPGLSEVELLRAEVEVLKEEVKCAATKSGLERARERAKREGEP